MPKQHICLSIDGKMAGPAAKTKLHACSPVRLVVSLGDFGSEKGGGEED